MIVLNEKTQQDFLNREWVQKLLDAGVDMSDAKYGIFRNFGLKRDEIATISSMPVQASIGFLPTYTVSELLYKLHEWIYPKIGNKQFSGGLTFFKDAPFYVFYYDLKTKDYNPLKLPQEQTDEWNESFIAQYEYPIWSLASLLIQCHKRDIGMGAKDTGDISEK